MLILKTKWLKKFHKYSTALSLALDESTDLQDQLQLAVFVRYVKFWSSCKRTAVGFNRIQKSTRGVVKMLLTLF